MKTSRRERKWMFFACVAPLFLLGSGAFWISFNALPVVNIPNPPLPKPNAFDFYVKAGKACVPAGQAVWDLTENASLDKPATMKQYLKPPVLLNVRQNAPALALLRKGFAYEYHQPPQRSFQSPFPFLARFRQLSRALNLESNVKAARGDWQGATRSELDILRLTHDFPHGGPLIVSLSATSMQLIASDQIALLLPHLDSPTCRMAAREIEKLYATRVHYWQTLQEEKWFGQAGLLEMMRKSRWRTEIMQAIGYKGAAQRPTFVLMSKRALMNSYSAFMDEIIAGARLPYAKTPPFPPANDFYSAMIEPIYSPIRCSIARSEARNALLMLALALRAYKLETGAFPQTLSQLAPSYLKAIPADPFGSGEALRYRKTGTTYILWSIGPDKTDDNGTEAIGPQAKTNYARRLIQPDSVGDFVFGVNH